MAYIFDPIRNTFVDDEDTSLGNKLALNDNDELDKAIRQLDEQFGPGTTFPASEAPIPPKTIERDMYKNAFKESAADGGMMRKNFADNPLKNFNITMDFPFELNKPLGKTYEIGDKSILKNLQSFDNINPNLRKNYISETTLKKILNAPGSTFQDQK